MKLKKLGANSSHLIRRIEEQNQEFLNSIHTDYYPVSTCPPSTHTFLQRMECAAPPEGMAPLYSLEHTVVLAITSSAQTHHKVVWLCTAPIIVLWVSQFSTV